MYPIPRYIARVCEKINRGYQRRFSAFFRFSAPVATEVAARFTALAGGDGMLASSVEVETMFVVFEGNCALAAEWVAGWRGGTGLIGTKGAGMLFDLGLEEGPTELGVGSFSDSTILDLRDVGGEICEEEVCVDGLDEPVVVSRLGTDGILNSIGATCVHVM